MPRSCLTHLNHGEARSPLLLVLQFVANDLLDKDAAAHILTALLRLQVEMDYVLFWDVATLPKKRVAVAAVEEDAESAAITADWVWLTSILSSARPDLLARLDSQYGNALHYVTVESQFQDLVVRGADVGSIDSRTGETSLEKEPKFGHIWRTVLYPLLMCNLQDALPSSVPSVLHSIIVDYILSPSRKTI